MPLKETLRRRWKWLLVAVPLALVVLVVGGTFVYIHFISPDPAPRLTFASVTTSSNAGGSSSSSAAVPATIDVTWKVTNGSEAGYRVTEVLNGQDNEATGRTTQVSGQLEISGTTVKTGSFTVDMASIASGSSQRDGQFRGRIMETSRFPTSTFELTSPIELGKIPADLEEISVKATGKLTLHGTTKDVTIDLKARRNGANLEVNGSLPITFSDYAISNPSGGPASVGNDGEMEFLIVLTKS